MKALFCCVVLILSFALPSGAEYFQNSSASVRGNGFDSELSKDSHFQLAGVWLCTYKTKNSGIAFRGTDSSQIAAKRMARNRCLSGSSEGIYNPSWCVFQGCRRY